MSTDLPRLRRSADQLRRRYDHLTRAVAEEQERLTTCRARLTDVLEAQKVIQHVAQQVQSQAHRRIASLVSSCLSSVFGDDAYRLAVHFDRKRGRTEARLTFARGGREVDPTSAAGGGVCDVAAMGLRLSAVVLSKVRRGLVLDEPFRFVSKGYRPQVRALLEALSRDLGVQVIMVTHSSELEIGKVVEL